MSKRKERQMILPRAARGRGFVEPRYSPSARRFMIFVGGWYLRLFERVKKVELRNEHKLIQELEQFYRGGNRVIIAFRHAAKEDAPLMMYALNNKLNRQIRSANRRRTGSQRIIGHAKFLYGRDVLDWAGKAAAWLFPRIGCVPVQNRSTNRTGLTILRTEMQKGQFPIALAPEGQVTYHMYQSSEISSGIASLAYWGQQSTEDVTIVPVALAYRHTDNPDLFIRDMLLKWEKISGKTLERTHDTPVIQLLLQATGETVELLEQVYSIPTEPQADLRRRIIAICEKALQTAEMMCGLQSEGTLLDRLFRIRYQGVEAIRPELFDPKELPPVQRSIADLHALEAHVYLRHSQIVDVLQYIDPDYISPPCTSGRACEYVLNLLDVLNRARGGNINTRFTPKGKHALVNFGEPVRLKEIRQLEDLPRKKRLRVLTDTVRDALDEISHQSEDIWEDSAKTLYAEHR